MQLNEVRKRFLDYMKSKGHNIVSSSPIIPLDDSTTLFVGSGMQPLLPYLLGEKHPSGSLIANSQICFRANDLEEVGDNRHTTFFEMLGNWSFGNYFKEEQIKNLFYFLVDKNKGLGLDPQKLYITVFGGDEKFNIPRDDFSANVWKELFKDLGIKAEVSNIGSTENGDKVGMKENERIFFYDSSKNWWSRAGEPKNMPNKEPGGSDTEVFYDFGEEFTDKNYKHLMPHPNSDSGRFIEICNSVFMEYKKENDVFVKLPSKNVDFGAGLERMTAATNGNPDVFLIDVFKECIDKIGNNYKSNPIPYRIIADHLRASIFIISEGVKPSNQEQGYILRRLIRGVIYNLRYVLNSKMEIKELIDVFIDKYDNFYNFNKKEEIIKTIEEESKTFEKTLQNGQKEFDELKKKGELTGEELFNLQCTYGFPIDLTLELAKKDNLKVDLQGYKKALQQHKKVSKGEDNTKFKSGLEGHSDVHKRYHTATHLLHKALKDILGEEVSQKGSNITSERLRFDFNFARKLTKEELEKIENTINKKVDEGLKINYTDLPKSEAKKMGAICLFDDKYGDIVRVYKIGDYSLEFCEGPHVSNTKEIGHIKITKEEAVSQGVRRVRLVFI